MALVVAAIGLTCLGVAAMLATGEMPAVRTAGLLGAASAVAVGMACVVAWRLRR
jgi:hypothetical protein